MRQLKGRRRVGLLGLWSETEDRCQHAMHKKFKCTWDRVL